VLGGQRTIHGEPQWEETLSNAVYSATQGSDNVSFRDGPYDIGAEARETFDADVKTLCAENCEC